MNVISLGDDGWTHNPHETWRTDAACLGTDTELFVPEKGGETRTAKKICGGCTVVAACLEYAIAHGERHGVYGGKSERERRVIERARRAAAA